MKAWLLPALTGIDSMTIGDAPDPQPGPGQIVLDLQFASLNPADNYLSIGQYPAKPAFPHILGRDGIGTVRTIGPNVTGIKPGDTRLLLRSDVGVNLPGTLAQQVAVDAARTTTVPQGWSNEQAAAAPLVYLAAWQALTFWGPLPQNCTTLITGASGGVGVAATQLAHALGHKVIALSRSNEKSETLRKLGTAAVFDPNDNWRKTFKDQFPGKVDLAIDNIAGESFNHVLDVMGNNGRISCVGRLAGPVPSFNTAQLFFRNLRIGGISLNNLTNEQAQTGWQNILQALNKTNAKPLIDHIFPFDQVPAAFARLKQGPMGKILIAIK